MVRQAAEYLSGVLIVILLALALNGCTRPSTAHHPRVPARTSAPKIAGTPIHPKALDFTQDGLHNCGTVAMLISWTKTHPQEARDLVRRQADGSYLVSFKGARQIRVTADDLAAATESRVVQTKASDPWAKVVLTAFTKLKCGDGPLDFRVTDWIYAGEIASCLTDASTSTYHIKHESVDANGRIRVGEPVSPQELSRVLDSLRGRPIVAYTNRRIHIWAVLVYDPSYSRVLARNPRRSAGEWLSVTEFRRRIQLVVYAE